MSRQIIISAFIVCFVLFSTDALKGVCNMEEDLLQRCSMALPVLSSPDISFALTRGELDKSCVELRAGIKCIDNYTEVCMERHEQAVFRRIYSGIAEVVGELCARGGYQEEYLRHAACVQRARGQYEACSRAYEGTLAALTDHHRSERERYHASGAEGDAAGGDRRGHEDYLRTVCCSFREYLSCSERAVRAACGGDAAAFTSAFLKRMASNIIKNFCLEYRGQECGSPGAGGAAPAPAPASRHTTLLIGVAVLAHVIGYLKGNLVPA